MNSLLFSLSTIVAVLVAPALAQSGQATFYSPYVPSSCYGFDTSKFPPGNLIAAASKDLFRNKALCGAYFEITCKGAVSGSGGCSRTPTVKVRVVDLCPGCHANSFDLSIEAFSRIAKLDVGRIKITSRRVSGVGEEEEGDEIEMVVGRAMEP
ncbi:EG45-like domain containing protein [Selaginella moellendorffii]|nr:EG45-like domain containing protein [Selaginella moellendorffii]|eukprot:XP_002962308.2 EG45-like domain containing protein [Selaginella moellendorffii]